VPSIMDHMEDEWVAFDWVVVVMVGKARHQLGRVSQSSKCLEGQSGYKRRSCHSLV
jgi:hypothetical protein